MGVFSNGALIYCTESYLHFYILVLEHLGIVLFELSGNFVAAVVAELVGNFVLVLVRSFVLEPKTHTMNSEWDVLLFLFSMIGGIKVYKH